MRLFSKKDKVTEREAKQLLNKLKNHNVPEKAAQKTVNLYKNTKNTYTCKNCGHTFPKNDATVSGYNSQNSLRHVHCPKCGKKLAYNS